MAGKAGLAMPTVTVVEDGPPKVAHVRPLREAVEALLLLKANEE